MIQSIIASEINLVNVCDSTTSSKTMFISLYINWQWLNQKCDCMICCLCFLWSSFNFSVSGRSWFNVRKTIVQIEETTHHVDEKMKKCLKKWKNRKNEKCQLWHGILSHITDIELSTILEKENFQNANACISDIKKRPKS